MFALKTSAKTISDGRSKDANGGSLGSGPQGLIQPKCDPLVSLVPGVQPKLTMGKAGDRYEREADSVAEKVNRGEKSGPISKITSGSLSGPQLKPLQASGGPEEEESVQTKAKAFERQMPEDEEKPIQRKAMGDEEEEAVQTKSGGPSSLVNTGGVSATVASASGGTPLPSPTKQKLEQGMDADLGGVRIHKDPSAQAAASSIGARAFTRGSDIFMGPGESAEDTSLIAHETTHVIQQGAAQQTDLQQAASSGSGRDVDKDDGADLAPAPLLSQALDKQNTDRGADTNEPPPQTPGSRESGSAAAPADRGADLGPAAPKADRGADPGATGPGIDRGADSGTAEPQMDRGADKAPDAADADRGADSGGSADAAGADGAAPAPADRGADGPQGKAPKEGEKGKDAKGKESSEPAKGEGKEKGEEPKEDPAAASKKKRLAEEKKRLKKTVKKVHTSAKQQQGVAASPGKAASTAKSKSGSASAAAPSPAKEAEALGKGTQVETMEEQKPGKVKKETFAEVVKRKLREMKMPANPKQMSKFKKSGAVSKMKGDIQGEVGNQKNSAAGDIATATTTAPTPAEPRVPTPLPPQPPGPKAADVSAKKALPQPLPEAEVSLEGNKQEVAGEMAKENLNEERLLKANDPRFSSANESKKEVDSHAETGPQEYRKEEQKRLTKEKAAMNATEAKAGTDMMMARAGGDKNVEAAQKQQMSKEEQARAKITKDLENIYNETRTKVETKLSGMDAEVDRLFDAAEKSARATFENFVDDEFDKWKDKRYDGLSGKWTWVKDRFRDINELPAVKQIYVDGQDKYFEVLDKGIDRIGTYVDTTLAWCQTEIKKGKVKVKEYIANLSAEQKKLGGDAVDDIMGKFDDLKSQVEDKRDALADKVVQKYQQASEKLAARIEEIKDANRSLVVKAKRKIKAVLDAIDNFRKKIMSLLAKARDVVEKIIDDPIGFLKNLLRAVKKGFELFKTNIVKHLKAGVFGWLFGTFASKGIELPTDFSFKSVLKFLFALMGITYERMRKKAVRLIGARNVAVIEQMMEWLNVLISKGPMGIWEKIKETVGNFKEMVIEEIKTWLITKIVKAAVTKLVSMFNPVGAIVQAVLTIYNVIMFFVERIDQIMQLVSTIVNSLGAIVAGKIDAAAQRVEQVMAQMIPLIIAFLARLLGIGGIAGRVMKIIKKVQRKVDKAIDKLLKKVVKKIKGLLKKGKAAFGKGKAAVKKAAGKVMGWLGLKSKPKIGGKNHKMYFKGKGKDAKLTVESTPVPLETFLKDLKAGKVKDKNGKPVVADPKDLEQLRRLGNKLDGVKRAGNFSKADQTQIAKLFRRITNLMGKMGAGKLPESRVAFKETSGNISGDTLGKEMDASVLSMKPGSLRGSEPSRESKLWLAVKKRKRAYIRGHLLNHHVHGPGTNKNLTPITGKLNTNMERDVESDVKKKVLGENKVVSYKVIVHYGGHGTAPYIPQEEHLSTKWQFRITELKRKPGRDGSSDTDWVNDSSVPVFNKVMKHDPPIQKDPGLDPKLMRINVTNWRSPKVDEKLAKSAFNDVSGVGDKRINILLALPSGSTFEGLKKITFDDKNGVTRRYFSDTLIAALQKAKNEKGDQLIHMDGQTKVEEAPAAD